MPALEQALSLWRGPPLADLAYEAFAQRETARLDELHAVALEWLVEAKLVLGRHGEVIGQLESLVDEYPYREGLRAQLMLALYRADRQADALQAYQDARRMLVEELGIEPGERLRELERGILAQDPGLATRVTTAAEAEVEAESVPSELPTGVVTFVLTDIEGSSGLWEADPLAMAAALELHDELVARAAEEHAGRVLKTKGEGDSTLTVFRRASDAVAGAVAVHDALAATAWPGGLELRVRIAVHTGEAHERGGDFFGPALNRAARLRNLARGGGTVLSQATTEIVRDRLPPGAEVIDLGRQALRGLSRPENVFELRVGARDRAPGGGPHDRRKTVTVLFAAVGATATEGGRIDPEVRRRVVAPAAMEMRAVLERHGGTVETYPGDALMAVFGVPVLHEDDALRAVRAAAEMCDALPTHGDEAGGGNGVRLTLRVGVGTGEVIAALASAGEPLATGEAVSVAKGLEEVAGAAEVLIDEETHRLVRSSVRAEDAERRDSRTGDPIEALRLVEMSPDSTGRASRLDSPLVGRDRPLGTLTTVFGAAATDRACHLVTVLGAAGVGKSRLVREFAEELGDEASVVTRPLPAVRRGHHLLAAGRGREGHDAGGRRGVRPRHRRAARRRAEGRPDRRRRVGGRGCRRPRGRHERGDLLGRAAAVRGRGSPPPARGRVRRPPVGRADLPRPGRARGGPVARRPDHAAVPGPARAARRAAGLGRRQAERHLDPARAARRRRHARADREPPQPRDPPGGDGGADRRRHRGQPALRRGALGDADRRRPAAPRGRPLDGRRRDGRPAGPAHDPCPARGAHRGVARARAGAAGARLRGGHGVPPRGARCPDARRGGAGARARPVGAGPARPDQPRAVQVRRRRGVPLPAHTDPRRGLSLASEGEARGAPPALRRLDRGGRGIAARGVRGDPRLPPRAGLPAARAARCGGGRRRGAGRARGEAPRGGGEKGARRAATSRVP